MARGGRPPKSTAEERDRARALAAEGTSLRQIAAQVFGDTRYYGRVDRILHRIPTRTEAAEVELSDTDTREAVNDVSPSTVAEGEELTVTEMIRELVNRHWQRAHADGSVPPVRELAALLRLERQLEAREQFERLQEITREHMSR